MNKEECKKLLPAITHFVNGGELWYYSNTDRKWYKQDNFITQAEGSKIHNIIEDKHFEARKHFALGGEVEFRLNCISSWLYSSKEPSWNEYEYRPKPKDVYEWQWIRKCNDLYYMTVFRTEEQADESSIKFELSKRIKK